MSEFLSELGGITGGVASEGLAFAVGFAAGRALTPAGVTIEQDAWNAAQVRRLDALVAAAVAAEKYAEYDAMATEASYHGYEASRFQRLYDITITGPGAGDLLNMLRRGTITDDQWEHGLRKQKLESQYDPAMRDLATLYIGLGDIATAIVRGAVPAPSWVPVAPPTTTDHVPRFPVTNVDPIALAGKLGYSEDMLRIMTARSGLSLAPILATQANFRGVLTDNDWLLAIAEGDLRTEWAATLKEAAREIPTLNQMMEHSLRGFESIESAQANAERHGVVAADSQLVYDNLGRAVAVHAVTTALARGGTYPGNYDNVPEPYKSAIQRSNIREEWAELAYANRYTYPSAFVLRTLAQAGELGDTAAVEQILLEIGWKPSFAATVAASWTGATTAAPAKLTTEQKAAIRAIGKSYTTGRLPKDLAEAELVKVPVPVASFPEYFNAWDITREATIKGLTPAQIKKALGAGLYSEQEAITALISQGYTDADAQTFLAE